MSAILVTGGAGYVGVIPRLLLAAQGRLPFFGILGDRHPTPDGTCIRDYVHGPAAINGWQPVHYM